MKVRILDSGKETVQWKATPAVEVTPTEVNFVLFDIVDETVLDDDGNPISVVRPQRIRQETAITDAAVQTRARQLLPRVSKPIRESVF